MEKKKRTVAILLAVTVLFVMLCFALFIAAEANHDCTGESCPICRQIDLCQNTVKNLSLALCAIAFTAALTDPLSRGVSTCASIVRSNSLVALKVKLSN